MAASWKLYLSCWFLGAAVQSAVFFCFNAVDYFNFFFPDDYKPEVYAGVTVGVGASIGAVLTVTFPPRRSHLTVLLVTLTTSAILLVAEVVVTPLDGGIISTPARFAIVLAIIFVATVVQNVGGGALYGFVGKHFPKFGVHAAQSGGVCAFAATFIIRCISKGSFEHLKSREQGFRLSGFLFVALVDLIILIACALIAVLRAYVREATAERLRASTNGETQPLLSRSDEFVHLSRKAVMRKNWSALTTICLTLVISNALFPGITSQFHGKYNCSSPNAHPPNFTELLDESSNRITPSPPQSPQTSGKTGWFVVILFSCFSVADAIGKNLPILGIIYNRTNIICNCLVQLVLAVPILLIYLKPCDSNLQADWVADVTVGLLGLVNGYGLCAAMMLLAPGQPEKKHEEGLATSIGFMALQVGILLEQVSRQDVDRKKGVKAPKRSRTVFSPAQLERLEGAFSRQQYVAGEERRRLAASLQLTETDMKVWFQNRRIRFRKQGQQQTSTDTKSRVSREAGLSSLNSVS